jgi:L-fuculose-phosphate aldolase
MWLAVELETLARQYYLSLALEGQSILTDEQIAEVARGFASYGLKSARQKGHFTGAAGAQDATRRAPITSS